MWYVDSSGLPMSSFERSNPHLATWQSHRPWSIQLNFRTTTSSATEMKQLWTNVCTQIGNHHGSNPIKLQLKSTLIFINLGQTKSDNINQTITITNYFYI